MNESWLFPLHEYQQRVAKLRTYMQERDISLLLIDQTEFLFYLTGFGISENMYRACLLPLTGEPVMVFRAMDERAFSENSWITDTVTFHDWQDPLAVLADTVRARGWESATLGIDFDSYCMTINRFQRLQALLPKIQVKDFSGVLKQLRTRKIPQEIECIKQSAAANDQAIREVVAEMGVGKTERQAAEIIHRVLIRHGMDSNRCGIVTTGGGNSFLHANMQERPLEQGDILHLEVVSFKRGYSSKIMRSVIIGTASAAQQEIAQQLIAIQDKQLAAMKPGAVAKDIDALARNAVLKAGLRQDYASITGYTLGYYPKTTPRTSDFSHVFLPTSEWLLEAGMVFHMYLYAAGLAISETVLVTENGCERLTKIPRQLFTTA